MTTVQPLKGIQLRARAGGATTTPRFEPTWRHARVGIELGLVGGFIATTAASSESVMLLRLNAIARALASFVSGG